MDDIRLVLPGGRVTLKPNNKIRLGRFSVDTWIVNYGWYSVGGDRAVCGWYLVKEDDAGILKPLHKSDIDDIYMVTY